MAPGRASIPLREPIRTEGFFAPRPPYVFLPVPPGPESGIQSGSFLFSSVGLRAAWVTWVFRDEAFSANDVADLLRSSWGLRGRSSSLRSFASFVCKGRSKRLQRVVLNARSSFEAIMA